jgi:phytoene synthase
MLCLQILGVSGEPRAIRYARDVGVALQLANILRDVREDADFGRIYLPRDELATAGVSDDDVRAGRPSPGLRTVCRRQADRARALIADARRGLPPELARPLLVPEIWADVYLALLDRLEEVDFDVFGRPPYLRRRRKLALALRRWVGVSPRAQRLSALAGRR